MSNRNDPICVQFGRNLRRMRSLAGLSQWELGQRLGVSYQQVQKYEKGRDNATVAMMCRLRIILNCEFADLLAGLGRTPEPGGVAEAGPQRRARRMAGAMLAIGDAGVQEGLIRLAQSLAEDQQGGRTGRRGRPRKAGPRSARRGRATGRAATDGGNET